MADEELPPAPSESADEAAKAETIRITLPAKPETPTAKRETVRINLPGKAPGGGIAPKKETTKIIPESGVSAAPPAPAAPAPPPSGAAKPFVPGAPKPPGAAGAPPPPAKPMSGLTPPPKPPTLGKPTVPLKPGAPPVGVKPAAPAAPGIRPPASGVTAPEPVTQKAAAPKKETARITLPAEGAKPGLPKATVKMQQTQPLVRQPSASTIQAAPMIQTTPASISSVSSSGPVSDGLMNVLAIVAFIVSIGAAVLAFLAYQTSQLS
jgi:hypothetical protein